MPKFSLIPKEIKFYDLFEKVDGRWLMNRRVAIFEKDRLDPVQPSLKLWIACLFINFKKRPTAYRYLAYITEKAGHKLSPNIIADKSNQMELIYQAGDDWLAGKANKKTG